jgi:hypothetical protein
MNRNELRSVAYWAVITYCTAVLHRGHCCLLSQCCCCCTAAMLPLLPCCHCCRGHV